LPHRLRRANVPCILGRHFAQTLAAAGCIVGLAARRADRLDDIAAEIGARGGTAIPLQMDVTDPATVGASLDRLTEATGLPTIIVNMSKAALLQMTKVLALELARHDIRVNAIAPGYFETDLNRDFLRGEAGQKIIRRVPMRRSGSPEDLDGALLLLASARSRFMTGSIIPVDGGHLVSGL